MKYALSAVCAVWLVGGGLALAETSRERDPLDVKVVEYALDNGLTVLLSRDDRLPVVAVEMRFLVGSGHEKKGRTGFAHLFEHLMFQGSKNFDDEYFKPFVPIGGAVNGTTNNARTNYFETVPSNYLELALWMESDRMETLLDALTQDKLDEQRDVVKNERRQRYENQPYGTTWLRMFETLYPEGHPYHHATIGSHEDLTAASLDDVKEFFRKYYAPKNAVLTIVGDFDEAKTKELIAKYFGKMGKGERAPDPKAESPASPTEVVHVVEKDEVPLPRVHMVWHTPALYADGDAEMDVLASVLTDGKTSRLYKPLVYDTQVAKDVAAYQVSLQKAGFFVVQATAAPGVTTDQLAKALVKEVEKALSTPPTADELERSINGWRKSFFSRVESVMKRAQMISTYYHFLGKPNSLRFDLERYSTLTAEKIQSAAKKFLNPKAYYRLDVVPAEPAVAKGGAQ